MIATALAAISVIGYATFLWYPIFRIAARKLGYYYADNGRPIPLTMLQYVLASGQGFFVGFLFNVFYGLTAVGSI